MLLGKNNPNYYHHPHSKTLRNTKREQWQRRKANEVAENMIHEKVGRNADRGKGRLRQLTDLNRKLQE